MAKDQWEEETIERFRGYLIDQRGQTLAITGRDVVVDPISKENFDYQLTSSTDETIAVELYRLVESESEIVRDKIWSQVVTSLKEELTTLNVKGYLIYLPSKPNVRFRDIPQYARQTATAIVNAIAANTGASKFTAAEMTFHRIEQYESVSLSWGSTSALD